MGTTANPHSLGRINRSFLLHHNVSSWNLRSRHCWYWVRGVHLGALWSLFHWTDKELCILERRLRWPVKWSEHWRIKDQWQTMTTRSLLEWSQNDPEWKLDPVGPRQKVTDWMGQKYTIHREKKNERDKVLEWNSNSCQGGGRGCRSRSHPEALKTDFLLLLQTPSPPCLIPPGIFSRTNFFPLPWKSVIITIFRM